MIKATDIRGNIFQILRPRCAIQLNDLVRLTLRCLLHRHCGIMAPVIVAPAHVAGSGRMTDKGMRRTGMVATPSVSISPGLGGVVP